MIIKTIHTYVCDVCGEKNVSRFKILTRYEPGYPCNSDKVEEYAYVDLCQQHSEEFDKLFDEQRASKSGYPQKRDIKQIICGMKTEYREMLLSCNGAGI